MSEPTEIRAGAARIAGELPTYELPTYSKDYWDIVFEQIAKRPLVKAALAMLALLYASAIYAPLIANDRPYLIEAVDNRAYDAARKGLLGVAGGIQELAVDGQAVYEEKSAAAEAARPDYSAALASEHGALVMRLDEMRKYLPQDAHAPLAILQQEADVVVESARAGRRDEAERLGLALVESVKAARKEYAAAPPDGSAPGVTLQGKVSYPLFDAISGVEVFFMVLWLFVLSWPLWNRVVNRRFLQRDRDRIRSARRRKAAVVVGVSLSCAVVWQLVVGGATSFDLSPYKERLTTGEISASRVVFPPLRLGFAETHIAELYREPTWLSSSELNDEGHHVRGDRVPVRDPVTGHMPEAQPVDVRYGEPALNSGLRHIVGTDILGRDLLVRLLYGGRISLSVGFVSTILLVFIGIIVGAVTGYFGGVTDIVGSRVIEIFQSIPAFFLILTAVALVPEQAMNPIFTIVLVIGLIRWTGVARLVRGEFLKLKELEFVVAARALGLRPSRVIFRHVLPNAMGPVLVAAAFGVASGILTESAISFLGFGVKHPIPSWGSLLNESRAAQQWWLQVFPGLMIFLTVFCYNLVGEGIRDALDPRMKS